MEVILGAAAVAVALLGIGTWIWIRTTARKDREVFRQMEPIMEDLWTPLRFLADLRSVWPDLNENQRAEIEQSSTYKDGFHQERAQAHIAQLEGLARNISSIRHVRIRAAILEFLNEWESKEPDSLKVILAMVRDRAVTP